MESASFPVPGPIGIGSVFSSVRNSAADASRRFERLLERPWVWVAAIASVAILQLALIFTHRPWLDEYQALLIAIEPASFRETLAQLHYEGHPPLWYLLLRGLGFVAPAALALPIASVICATVIQGACLLFSPFPRAERLMLALGEIFLFEYGTISRGLALGAALVMLALALWRRRAVWIAIALLPLCEFLFGAFSAVLVVLLWRERRISLWGLGLWAACSIAAALSVIPAADAAPALGLYPFGVEVSDFMERVGTLALPFQTFRDHLLWDGMAPLLSGVILGPLMLIWAFKRTAHSSVQRRLVVAFFALCLAMSVSVYALHFRYVTLIALMLIAFAWIQPPPAPDRWWRPWLAVSAICGLLTSALALSKPFDAAPEVASVIRKVDDGRRPWLAFPASRIPALHALTGKRFIQPEQACSHGFVRWNHRTPIHTWAQYRHALADWANFYGQSFIVLEYMPRDVPESVFTPLTGRLHGYDGQYYVVGILAPNGPIRDRAFPSCASATNWKRRSA